MADLKARITFSEFLEWVEFLKMREKRTTKEDIYLAQIAAEARRGWVDNPKKVNVSDFLLGEQREGEEKMKQSKQIWAAWLGIDLKKN